jgi:DNA-binding transcriptional regulator YhcF (GntR family)
LKLRTCSVIATSVNNNIGTMAAIVNPMSLSAEGAAPRYEQIANALCEAIRSGRLKPGDRLRTARAPGSHPGVSSTNVTAAFKSLAESGWTRGEIGRGTFVAERHQAASSPVIAPGPRALPCVNNPWRRRAVAQAGACGLDGAAALRFSKRRELQF